MSRGPGRCQRRILEVVKGTPERRMSRTALEEALVTGEGYSSSNLLRGVRGLVRMNLVTFQDEPRKADAVVHLPHEVAKITDDKLTDLLAELGGRT